MSSRNCYVSSFDYYKNIIVDWKSSTKIIAASVFSAILAYFIHNQLNITSWISLLLWSTIFLVTYILTAPLIGAITYNDTKNLKDAVKSLGPLALIVNLLLGPIEKITSATQKRNLKAFNKKLE